MQAERIFSAEQIKVPGELPNVLRDFAKEVIRYQPAKIAEFGKDYFTAMEKGELETFLREKEEMKKIEA